MRQDAKAEYFNGLLGSRSDPARDRPKLSRSLVNKRFQLTQKRFTGVERSEHVRNCVLNKPERRSALGYGLVMRPLRFGP